jgi:hypothetical protein
VIANGAESSLEHHLGMTCDPVAGFVQVPCIERCAYGAVKAWTGFAIASNEIPTNRRVDFDATVAAMALTAKEMNSKYKETSEGGLAVPSCSARARRWRVSGGAGSKAFLIAWLVTAVYCFTSTSCARRRRAAPVAAGFGITAAAVASLVGPSTTATRSSARRRRGADRLGPAA